MYYAHLWLWIVYGWVTKGFPLKRSTGANLARTITANYGSCCGRRPFCCYLTLLPLPLILPSPAPLFVPTLDKLAILGVCFVKWSFTMKVVYSYRDMKEMELLHYLWQSRNNTFSFTSIFLGFDL